MSKDLDHAIQLYEECQRMAPSFELFPFDVDYGDGLGWRAVVKGNQYADVMGMRYAGVTGTRLSHVYLQRLVSLLEVAHETLHGLTQGKVS